MFWFPAFISKRGHSADILDLVATFEEISLVLSDEILKEFIEVMAREEVRTRFGYNKLDISELDEAIRGIAEIVKVESDFRAVEEDPEDDIVVNTAYDGKVDYIVSVDSNDILPCTCPSLTSRALSVPFSAENHFTATEESMTTSSCSAICEFRPLLTILLCMRT